MIGISQSGRGVDSQPPDDTSSEKINHKHWLAIISSSLALLFFITTLIFVSLFTYTHLKNGQPASIVIQAAPDKTVQINSSTSSGASTEQPHYDVCNTPECVITAGRMAQKMNVSADPCVDFYEFACGRFMKEATLPSDRVNLVPLADLRESNTLILKDILAEEIKKGDSAILKSLKNGYQNCMDEGLFERRSLEIYQSVMDSPFVEHWPTLNRNWTGANFRLGDVIVRFVSVDVSPLYRIILRYNPLDSKQLDIYLYTPTLALPRAYFSRPRNDTIIMAYQKYLTLIAVELGASRNVAEQDAKDVVDLEIALSDILPPIEEEEGYFLTYNPSTLKELSTLYPELDITGTCRKVVTLQDGTPLPGGTLVINQFPTYMGNLSRVVKQFSNRTLLNLFAFKYFISQATGLTARIRMITNQFVKVLRGQVSGPDRWQLCVTPLANAASAVMEKEFLSRKPLHMFKAYVKDMFDNLKNTFKQMVQENTWMKQSTKEEVFKKLAAITLEMVYDSSLDKASRNLAKYKMRHPERNDSKRWPLMNSSVSPHTSPRIGITAYETAAQFSLLENLISLSPGILQPPVFSNSSPHFATVQHCNPRAGNFADDEKDIFYKRLPGRNLERLLEFTWEDNISNARLKYINYGALGMIIGHEVIHGFDNLGSYLDEKGNKRNWWQQSDWDTFNQKLQCIVNQTSDVYLEKIKLNLNGVHTLTECVSDNVGLKMSFRAYKELVRKKGEQPRLPVMNFTQDQLYFLSFSQLWCEKSTKEYDAYRVFTDVHAFGKHRVLNPLKNSEDFAKAFNCPRGSDMNPEKKCDVW